MTPRKHSLLAAIGAGLLLLLSACNSDPAPQPPAPLEATCGNGKLEAGEACDDGNTVATDSCRNDCTVPPRCGDGKVTAGETCDDGNTVDTDACRNDCSLPPRCGDGHQDPGEACDDGNTVDTDACRNTCTTQPPPARCGDGNVDSGETCDDGNTVDTDACRNDCSLPPRCGDGHVTAGETCDDGNTVDTDACRNDCTLPPRCGDGHLDSGEVCDDGNTDDADTCRNDCTVPPRCGDGHVDSGETCDDGNTDDADTCRNNCTVPPRCGDGHVDSGETCDDGNTDDTDACRNNCSLPPRCGDGHVDPGETCDDGNAINGDGCENTCVPTPMGNATMCPGVTFTPPANGATCEVKKVGSAARLYSGVVLKDGETLAGGQVLVSAEGVITCAACDCSGAEGAADATVVSCPQGVITPGLINAHDHITYQKAPGTDVPTAERYEHRHDWRIGGASHAGHNKLASGANGQSDLIRWAELRQVMAGTTSVAGSGGQAGLLRNLDKVSVASGSSADQAGLGEPAAYYQTFPLDDSSGNELTSGCGYGNSRDFSTSIPSLAAYLPHVGEGIEESARNEFRCAAGAPLTQLLTSRTAVIHGIGVTAQEIGQMAAAGTGLIWSPRSNVSLYGDTAMVTAYQRMGVEVALGTDWIQSGSMNMLRELQCADFLNSSYYGKAFTDEQLWRMATANAADVTGVSEKLGRIATGKVADLAVFRLNAFYASPHRAVVAAGAADVVLTVRGGKALYGDAALVSGLAQNCDAVDVCGAAKAACVQGEVNQSLAAMTSAATTTATSAFGPNGLYPLFSCDPVPANEPTCVPQRTSDGSQFPAASVNGSALYSAMRAPDDTDGDAVADPVDNCPTVFNAVRPLDNGHQADTDSDGVGDACDVCPLQPGVTSCAAVNPSDEDSDGTVNAQDNCPMDANADQLDRDGDGKGDACDVCPTANPGDQTCASPIAATLQDVNTQRNGVWPYVGTGVALQDLVVSATGVASSRTVVYAQTEAAPTSASAARSGIYLFGLTLPTGEAPLAVGDRFDITQGTVAPFNGLMELTGSQVTNVRRASATPVAVPVTVAELRDPVRATQLVGVLVEVRDVVVTRSEGSDEFTLAPKGSAEGTVGVRMDDGLFDYVNPALGTEYRALRGVLSFGFQNFKILPRSASDMLAPLPPLGSFGAAGNYIRVGTNGDSFPQALTVTLASAYPEAVTVSVTSADPAALTVANDGNVVVPAGQLSASVGLEPHAKAQSVELTASLGSSSQSTTVRVLGETELPASMTLTPNPIISAAGERATVTVGFDIPVPADTVVQMGVLPADLGGFANASLAVPLNATSATIELELSSAPSTNSGTVHAQLGSLSAQTEVQLTTALPKLDTLSPAGPVTVSSAGTQLFTVSLDLPALADVQVTLAAEPTTAGDTFGTVPASVTIPKDSTAATFTFAAGTVNADTSGTVTASLNGVTRTVDVVVQRPPARIVSVSPSSVRVAPSGTQLFTVTLDRAAPAAGATFPVVLNPTTLGTLDGAEVSVAPGATTGTVTFTASATDGVGQISFGTGAQTVSGSITVSGAQPGRVVISEFSGTGPSGGTDEFVELYNAGDVDVALDNWRVQYKSATGTAFSGSVTIPAGKVIKAHSYFLLGGGAYSGAATKDVGYSFDASASATAGGHIQVLDANSAVVDLLGWGTATAPEGGAGNAAPAHPASGGSLERKVSVDSTSGSMAVGGTDELRGNGFDTGFNKADFVIRTVRQPQNSASATETP